MKLISASVAVAMALGLGSAAQAVTPLPYMFGSFGQLDTTKIATYTPGPGSSTITINGGVVFIGACCTLPAFTPPPPMANIFTDAVISFTATTTQTVFSTGPQFEQAGYAGSISFTSPSNPGVNLLTVTFTDGIFNIGRGRNASASMIVNQETAIHYTSDIFFPAFIANPVSFAIEMTALTNLPFSIGSGYGKAFTANAGGSFSAILVPEPATWALLIAGFGMVGFAARRRRVTRLSA